jgi:EAL domain-containing protein (putative c-di-GMP-specific phosphodiesterase class I)
VDDKFLRQADGQLTGWDDPLGRLRAALDKNEFELYAQPIRSLAGGGPYPIAEVLVRLREEESALLPPGEFLPVFEHYRMMPQLDRWVVRTAARRIAKGLKVPRLSVNVSGQTLEDLEFPRFVAGELMESGCPAKALLFEIDEPDALARTEAAARFSAAVRTVGIGVMIDGFGRRAASFAPVKALRPDFLKVDGSITRRLLTAETAGTKLKAIVRVGEAAGFGVVAECVEDESILIRLKALGVGYAQGFGIYRPQPIASFAAA